MNNMQTLVLVEWEDSSLQESCWKHLSDMPEPEPINCLSVGWIIRKTKKAILLASSLGDLGTENAQGTGTIQIPISAIKKTLKLKKHKNS